MSSGSFSLRKGGNKVCGGAADELHEVAIGCVATTETDIEIEVFMVLRRIEAQLSSHIADALPVWPHVVMVQVQHRDLLRHIYKARNAC